MGLLVVHPCVGPPGTILTSDLLFWDKLQPMPSILTMGLLLVPPPSDRACTQTRPVRPQWYQLQEFKIQTCTRGGRYPSNSKYVILFYLFVLPYLLFYIFYCISLLYIHSPSVCMLGHKGIYFIVLFVPNKLIWLIWDISMRWFHKLLKIWNLIIFDHLAVVSCFSC